MGTVFKWFKEYRQVGKLMADGLTIAEIAEQMQYSRRKVSRLISEMKRWTHAKNHTQIVAVMFRKKYIK